jgi:hypothetical protein
MPRESRQIGNPVLFRAVNDQIAGLATHVEQPFASRCLDWPLVLNGPVSTGWSKPSGFRTALARSLSARRCNRCNDLLTATLSSR